MIEEDIRLAREQAQVDSNNSDSSFVSKFSGIFSRMSSHERTARRREKIRKDLVRVQFETESVATDSAKPALVTQLSKILHLD